MRYFLLLIAVLFSQFGFAKDKNEWKASFLEALKGYFNQELGQAEEEAVLDDRELTSATLQKLGVTEFFDSLEAKSGWKEARVEYLEKYFVSRRLEKDNFTNFFYYRMLPKREGTGENSFPLHDLASTFNDLVIAQSNLNTKDRLFVNFVQYEGRVIAWFAPVAEALLSGRTLLKDWSFISNYKRKGFSFKHYFELFETFSDFEDKGWGLKLEKILSIQGIQETPKESQEAFGKLISHFYDIASKKMDGSDYNGKTVFFAKNAMMLADLLEENRSNTNSSLTQESYWKNFIYYARRVNDKKFESFLMDMLHSWPTYIANLPNSGVLLANIALSDYLSAPIRQQAREVLFNWLLSSDHEKENSANLEKSVFFKKAFDEFIGLLSKNPGICPVILNDSLEPKARVFISRRLLKN